MAVYTPVISNAKGPNYTGRAVESAVNDSSYNQKIAQAGFIPLEVQNELLGLNGAALASSTFNSAYTMNGFSGSVNQPVRIDPGNDYNVLPANSTDSTHALVFGFISAVSTSDATKCFVSPLARVTGLSGLTRGSLVYLTDAGSFAATAGTFNQQMGYAVSTTDAIVSPLFPFSLPSQTAVGTAALVGQRTVAAKTTNYTILSTDSGTRFTNTGAGGAVVLTLPAAALGLTYSFTVVAAQSLKFQRAGSDHIIDAGASSYVSIANSQVASGISLTCTSAAQWTVDFYYGSGFSFA